MTENASSPTPSYTLTVEDVSRLFADAGLPRSPRSIMRYCQKAHLVAVKDISKFGEKYFINAESAEALVTQLLSVSRQDATGPDRSRPVGTRRDESRQDATGDELEQLKKENFDLKILNAGKDQAIAILKEDRAAIMHEALEGRQKIGELETTLRQLTAPKVDHISNL